MNQIFEEYLMYGFKPISSKAFEFQKLPSWILEWLSYFHKVLSLGN